MKKRIFAAAVVMVMAVSLFAGCSKKEEQPQTSAKSETAQAAETVSESETVSVPEAVSVPETETVPEAVSASEAVQPGQAAEPAVITGPITEEEAKQIALRYAEPIGEEDITFIKVERGFDDGIEKYEVEFIAGDVKYEYDIDVQTGAVLKTEWKMYGNGTADAASEPQTGGEITKEQALQIAKKAAGVAESDITYTEVKREYEKDYGREIYDVEIHVGRTEYSYDIDMTGAILDADIDIDD